MRGTPTQADLELIAKAREEMEAKEKKFFEALGITDQEKQDAEIAYTISFKENLTDKWQAFLYNTPIAKKMFVLGFVTATRKCKGSP